MGKHRHQHTYRRTVIAAVAVGVIGIPTAAMACVDWPGDGQRQDQETATSVAAGSKWDGPDWYHRWNGRQHGGHTAAPSATPTVTTSAPEADASQHGAAGQPHKPKRTAPGTAASKPATAAPKPTAVTSKPTTAASKPATAAPKPTTAAPKPTTVAPKPAASTPAPAATGGTEASGAVAEVVELVNAERSKAGCSPVKVNATLTGAAQKHSEDMAASGTMSHTGSDGSSPADRITGAGYDWSGYGENVAYGYSTPEQVMQGWMNSPGHRENILNCAFEEIGVGLAQPGSYWTQDFGTSR